MTKKIQVFVLDPYPLARRAICALIDRTPDLALLGRAGNLTQAIASLADDCVSLLVVEPLAAPGDESTLMAALLRAAPKAKILVLSARAEQTFVERVLSAGASGYVYKGESIEDTLSAMRDVLDGRPVVVGMFKDDKRIDHR